MIENLSTARSVAKTPAQQIGNIRKKGEETNKHEVKNERDSNTGTEQRHTVQMIDLVLQQFTQSFVQVGPHLLFTFVIRPFHYRTTTEKIERTNTKQQQQQNTDRRWSSGVSL
jgi:hypothetical protein